jgi:multidrug efflux pump subunit AcrB
MRSFTLLLLLASAEAVHAQSPILIEVQTRGYALQSAEEAVLQPLEKILTGMKAVERMRGLALDGRCLIRLDLAKNADPEMVRLMVHNRITIARKFLPSSCAAEILPQDDNGFMLITLRPGANMTPAESGLVSGLVHSRLSTVPGVAHIQVLGASRPRATITFDPERLRAYGLSSWEVVAAIEGSLQRFDDLVVMGQKVSVKAAIDGKALSNIPVILGKNIHLRDVAKVDNVDESSEDAGIAWRVDKGLCTEHAIIFLVQLSPGKLNAIARKGLEETHQELRTELTPKLLVESQLLQTGDTTVVMSLPESMDRAQREEKAQSAAKAMLELPLVHKVFWLVQPDSGEAILWVMADAGKKAELHKAIRAQLAQIKESSSRVGELYSPLFPWPSQGAQIAVRLSGKDFSTLHQTAEKLSQRLRKTSGIVDIVVSPRMGNVAAIELDREKAELAGTTVREIAVALNAHADKVEFPLFGETVRVRVEVPKKGIQKVEDLGKLEISKNKAPLLLGDVAKIRLIQTPNGGIAHEAGQRCVIVSANLEGRTLEEGRAEVQRIIRELTVEDVRIEME